MATMPPYIPNTLFANPINHTGAQRLGIRMLARRRLSRAFGVVVRGRAACPAAGLILTRRVGETTLRPLDWADR